MNSAEYFNTNSLADATWTDKYALRDKNNQLIESSPDDMHRRIAKELSRIESKKFKQPFSEQFIYDLLKGFSYIIPQGSPMFGIGNPTYISVSNCFVIDSPEDSYGGILRADQELVQISKRRGGVGLDISSLRHNGSITSNSSRTSTGIVPFAVRYSNSIREVGQDGRRGALMMTCSVHHPQILDFAESKLDKTKVTGANISVRITREFMDAVFAGTTYEQRFPIHKNARHFYKRQVDARTVWKKIIHLAWATAEPGVLFWDNIIEESPADCYKFFGFETLSTNPCGEIPLCPYDSCRLMCLNLFSYVKHPFTTDASFDYYLFYQHAKIAQRLMDDLVDIEIECVNKIIDKIKSDPEPDHIKNTELTLWKQILEKGIQGRRTGLGITALGDTIAGLNVKYGSDESIQITDQIYKTLKFGAYSSSVEMAKELGPFPLWDKELEKDNPFLNRIKNEQIPLISDNVIYGKEIYEEMQKYGRRNIALLTTAPTGSISILAGPPPYFETTNGIEPLFSDKEYTRRKKINPSDKNIRVDFVDANGDKWHEFKVYHSKLQMWMDVTGNKDTTKSPYYKACAEDIDWIQRVKLQATAQKHIDHSISSTINLPKDISEEKVAQIYETAYLAGCKGMTVYRKGCRDGVLIDSKVDKITKTDAPKRPKSLSGEVYHIKTNHEDYYVIIGLLNNEPYETFVGLNHNHEIIPKNIKNGNIIKKTRGHYVLVSDESEFILTNGHSDNNIAALTRMISTALRHGADISYVTHQLEKVKGDMQSFAKCLVKVLKKYLVDGTTVSGECCPNCNTENLIRAEGCVKCNSCGWAKC